MMTNTFYRNGVKLTLDQTWLRITINMFALARSCDARKNLNTYFAVCIRHAFVCVRELTPNFDRRNGEDEQTGPHQERGLFLKILR